MSFSTWLARHTQGLTDAPPWLIEFGEWFFGWNEPGDGPLHNAHVNSWAALNQYLIRRGADQETRERARNAMALWHTQEAQRLEGMVMA
jgi:hypothetical protein